MYGIRLPYIHVDSHGPHDGEVAEFFDAEGHEAGHIELKLHGDKGDLEAWLTGDDVKQPLDLPLDAVLTVRFPAMGAREVELRVRDDKGSADEDGHTNIRDGMMNYFVFPGNTGADSSWLSGATFQTEVQVLFSVDGKHDTTRPFELVPHAEHEHEHHPDHDNDHEEHRP